MKKLMLFVALATIPVYADWLDDIVEMVEKEDCFNYRKASTIIDGYINKDKERIAELEAHNQKSTRKGIVEKVKDVAVDSAQLVAARTSLKYHQGVADYFTRLSLNKEKRESFAQNCKEFSKLTCKLAKLEIKYSRTKSRRAQASLIAQMGAAKARVEAKRTYLKSILP